MKKKFPNIINKLWSVSAVVMILAIWQAVCSLKLVDAFMLPSPVRVVKVLFSEFPILMRNAAVTLTEAFCGLAIGILLGFLMAVLMDRFEAMHKAFYPIIVITQSVPTVAIAPLLVLWFGFEMAPKIILIVITTFFPIAVSLYDSFSRADKDQVDLLRAMGANKRQIFRYIKLPGASPEFFSALRISASYAVVGAVISEWLGGFSGLGVYMTRVRKAYAYDKMFAVIILISAISLLLMKGIKLLQKKCMPWANISQPAENHAK